MIKPNRIRDVADCTVGQIYLLISKYRDAEMVRCIALYDDNKMEIDNGGYKRKISLNDKYESDRIYEYNALLRLKYNRLIKQQEQERIDLLLGKDIIIYRLSELEQKEKWYNKLWKRLKKNYKH